jgi:uncharacterized protein (DUF2062 family)
VFLRICLLFWPRLAGRYSHRPQTEELTAMTDQRKHWKARLSKSLPDRNVLSAHPWLQPVARRILHPQLWRFQDEAVARGVAVGTFWAFVIPFGQIVVAAAHCIWWRANIPAAVAMTMVTNPLTIGFWLWLAYQLGSWILGEPVLADAAHAGADAATDSIAAWAWLTTFGWPTALGMALFATVGAAVAYAVVKVVWRER